ncbi:hypothetical protein PGT21_004473 [Puccinia graminis f. sp. tritici]|uniref:Uncharacterized protein n=1 Tax=Puccinia graminis f. sp. tritici TaxID=56615 RepID=A0A5B0QM52_PUCGR|nr:hypothetical protein PGT21_004473 [Puccinia graminis f. sp. tritici]
MLASGGKAPWEGPKGFLTVSGVEFWFGGRARVIESCGRSQEPEPRCFGPCAPFRSDFELRSIQSSGADFDSGQYRQQPTTSSTDSDSDFHLLPASTYRIASFAFHQPNRLSVKIIKACGRSRGHHAAGVLLSVRRFGPGLVHYKHIQGSESRIRFRSTQPTSSTNSRLPISSAVFDRICNASTTGLVGSIEFSSICQTKQGDWLAPGHGGVTASRSRF